MRGLVDLGEVALAEETAHLVVALHVEEGAVLLEVVEPVLDVLALAVRVAPRAGHEQVSLAQTTHLDSLFTVTFNIIGYLQVAGE